MPRIEVHRTYLTMPRAADLRPARPVTPHVDYRREQQPSVEHYRELYRRVGAEWHWHDRDLWSDAQLGAHLARPQIHLWVARTGTALAGYFELEQHADGSVEIVYFGLVPEAIGRGLGGDMLTRAVEEAWALGATRVWLHTCTLDSPRALPNYLARGFTFDRDETYVATLPD